MSDLFRFRFAKATNGSVEVREDMQMLRRPPAFDMMHRRNPFRRVRKLGLALKCCLVGKLAYPFDTSRSIAPNFRLCQPSKKRIYLHHVARKALLCTDKSCCARAREGVQHPAVRAHLAKQLFHEDSSLRRRQPKPPMSPVVQVRLESGFDSPRQFTHRPTTFLKTRRIASCSRELFRSKNLLNRNPRP